LRLPRGGASFATRKRYVTSIGLPSGTRGLDSPTSTDATAGLVSLSVLHEAASGNTHSAAKLRSSKVLLTLRCMR
jgi:hypothetical protein